MSSRATFSAGNAGASTYINLNGNVGGGDKKQGIRSTIGNLSNLNYLGTYGDKRGVVFNINQLGGVGKGKSMFASNADGVHMPVALSKTNTTGGPGLGSELPEEEPGLGSELPEEEENTSSVMNGTLLMTIAGSTTGGYNVNDGSRMFLVEMNDIEKPTNILSNIDPTQSTYVPPVNIPSVPSSIESKTTEYSLNTYYLDNTAQIPNYDKAPGPPSYTGGGLTYTKINKIYDDNAPYKKSYAASTPTNLKYVTVDFSSDVTISNTVNISLTRPGVVTTMYAIPVNWNTVVSGDNNNTGIPTGSSYDSASDPMTFNNLINALQDDTTGNVPESLIAEYGLGYNDAQGLGLGYSREIDFFEMTPCGFATTLHGGVEKDDNLITDKNGVWGSINGAYGTTDYTQADDSGFTSFTQSSQGQYAYPGNLQGSKYVQLSLYINGLPTQNSTALNKYGPGEDFFINTLYNITITNEFTGYLSQNMPAIWSEITGEPADSYDETDGWLHMKTTVLQTRNNNIYTIEMAVMSQGFGANSGVDKMNIVSSLWLKDDNYWLDGKESDSTIVRGPVSYEGSPQSESDVVSIMSSSAYNNLNSVYTTSDGYSSLFSGNTGQLMNLNPSISLLGDIDISTSTEGKTYGFSMDVKFRSIDDNNGFPGTFWSGQYALSYGVHYANNTKIKLFDTTRSILKNVPPVINSDGSVNNNIGTIDINTLYDTAIRVEIWDNTDNNNNALYTYSPNPGGYLTSSTTSFPDALDNNDIFTIHSNQLTYSGLGSLTNANSINGYSSDLLKYIMPTDGINYIVLK